jgi:hypothetical protein
VVGLHEGLLHGLPVGRQDAGDVGLLVALLERPALEVLGQVAEEGTERLGVRIHVDENETTPGADLHLGQTELLGNDLREVPLARHLLERAVEVPGVAVERAPQLRDRSGLFPQLAPAMEAGVVEGLDLVRTGPHEEDRDVGDVIDLGVTDLRQLALPAGHLPHLRPESLFLELVDLPSDVAVDRLVVLPERRRRLPAQHLGHRAAVRVEQVLVAQAWRAGATGGVDGERHEAPPDGPSCPSASASPNKDPSAVCWCRDGSCTPPIQPHS